MFRGAVMVAVALVGAGASRVAAQGASPFAGAAETRADRVVQLRGTVPLVGGAHGGSGGNNFDRSGKVIGTDETALDDVIGGHAVTTRFAYASVDRDGAISAAGGLALTNQFADLAAAEIARRLGRAPVRRYLLGLSMGGGIARAAAETAGTPYAGVVIVAGAGGDRP